jgi:hypothetical protein
VLTEKNRDEAAKQKRSERAKASPSRKPWGEKYGGLKFTDRRPRTRRPLMRSMREPLKSSLALTLAMEARIRTSAAQGRRAAKPDAKTALETARRKTSFIPAGSRCSGEALFL